MYSCGPGRENLPFVLLICGGGDGGGGGVVVMMVVVVVVVVVVMVVWGGSVHWSHAGHSGSYYTDLFVAVQRSLGG